MLNPYPKLFLQILKLEENSRTKLLSLPTSEFVEKIDIKMHSVFGIGSKRIKKVMGMFQIIGNNNGRHFFFQNLQNELNELIYYGIFIQFLLHRYIRDKIFSFLSVVQKH